MNNKELPIGKVKFGSPTGLKLTDGTIRIGKSYKLPPVSDGKTVGKIGKVTGVQMVWAGGNKISFMVHLEETSGQGWQFEYLPE